MTRDELIEELKKAPSNDEVEIVAIVTEDEFCPARDGVAKVWLRIDRIQTIPNIKIQACK